jgi:hypothetical protein
MRRLIAVILILTAGQALAQGDGPREVFQLDQPATKVDGAIEPGEYRSTFVDPRTGIEVFWQADSHNLQVALRSPGSGWLALGLGSAGMNGAVMIIGFQDAQGNWVVQEHLGKAFFRHAPAEKPRLISGQAKLVDGRLVMEFVLPLVLANGQVIAPGRELPFLLAYHKDKGKLSKHSKKSFGSLKMTRSPAQPTETGREK